MEAKMEVDPAIRREVDEIRRMAGLLGEAFAAEMATTPATPVTVPAKVMRKPRSVPRWPVVGVTAAAVMFAVTGVIALSQFGGSGAVSGTTRKTVSMAVREPKPTGTPPAFDPLVDGSVRDSLTNSRYTTTNAQPGYTWEPVPPPPVLAPSEPKPEPGDVGKYAEIPGIVGGSGGFGGGQLGGQLGGGGFQGGFGGGGMPGGYGGGGFQGQPSGPGRPDVKWNATPKDQAPVYAVPKPTPVPVTVSPLNPSTDSVILGGRIPVAEGYPPPGGEPVQPGDRYGQWVENPFVRVDGQASLSMFGVDVDTASYSIVRNYLTHNQLPPADAVRLEEIVNYFPYQDQPPTGDDPFAATAEMAECPWNPAHRLARIGLKAKPIPFDERPPSNLVFLIDVSGSMSSQNKLPLVQSALRLLVKQLGERDRVAIVVYAGASGQVLPSTDGTRKDDILAALDRLSAGGSTNGAGGLEQAYQVAVANFVKGGTNRVILCTDGDWNVGTTGTDALVNLIEAKRKTGVFLSVFGFGMGNLRDEMMVRLAGKGNGNYGYIDTEKEARKALVEQAAGTLVTVAKDVKIQVEFNPAAVKAYRLLGYEKRKLAAKDFDDDTKDAGEMGAGHTVTALYELVPADGTAPAPAEGLRYQPATPLPAVKPAGKSAEAFVVKMRHKAPDGDVSTLRELPVKNEAVEWAKASEDFRFSSAAAAFALTLRQSAYMGSASLELASELAEGATGFDPGGHRAEFVELVQKAKSLSGK